MLYFFLIYHKPKPSKISKTEPGLKFHIKSVKIKLIMSAVHYAQLGIIGFHFLPTQKSNLGVQSEHFTRSKSLDEER